MKNFKRYLHVEKWCGQDRIVVLGSEGIYRGRKRRRVWRYKFCDFDFGTTGKTGENCRSLSNVFLIEQGDYYCCCMLKNYRIWWLVFEGVSRKSQNRRWWRGVEESQYPSLFLIMVAHIPSAYCKNLRLIQWGSFPWKFIAKPPVQIKK